jgi:transcriptional regulator with XRE-family HTH domain
MYTLTIALNATVVPNLPRVSRTTYRIDGIEIDPEKVRYFRELRSLSRKALASRSGIPRTSIGYYERGIRKPHAENFRRLYTALGCGPEDLLARGFAKAHLRDKNVIAEPDAWHT